jgi:hypothetical protein
MLHKKLFEFLVSSPATILIKSQDPKQPLVSLKQVDLYRTRQTIRVLERICSDFSGKIRIDRQLKQSSVAAIFAVAGPNESIFIRTGRKRIPSLIESYYLLTRHPELAAKFIVDNEQLFEESNIEISYSRKSPSDQKDLILANIVTELALKAGPRGLGGRLRQTSLNDLRVVRIRPRKSKKKAFRRGYNDKGSTAPEHVKVRRQIESEHFEVIRGDLLSLDSYLRRERISISRVQTVTGEIRLLLRSTHGIEKYAEWTEVISLFEKRLNEYIELNNLEVEEVGRDISKLLDLG